MAVVVLLVVVVVVVVPSWLDVGLVMGWWWVGGLVVGGWWSVADGRWLVVASDRCLYGRFMGRCYSGDSRS